MELHVVNIPFWVSLPMAVLLGIFIERIWRPSERIEELSFKECTLFLIIKSKDCLQKIQLWLDKQSGDSKSTCMQVVAAFLLLLILWKISSSVKPVKLWVVGIVVGGLFWLILVLSWKWYQGGKQERRLSARHLLKSPGLRIKLLKILAKAEVMYFSPEYKITKTGALSLVITIALCLVAVLLVDSVWVKLFCALIAILLSGLAGWKFWRDTDTEEKLPQNVVTLRKQADSTQIG